MNNNRVYPNNSNVVTFKPRAIRGLLCHSLMINASIHHFIVISLAILFFGNVVFTATAMAGSLTATAAVTVVDIPPPQGNLALGAPAVASSAERLDTLAENAVDGDASSRWSSLFSDPQWIYVDLSAIYTIDRVVLNWETAYGKAYEIQVSRNTHNWVTVFTESNSDGGIDDLTFAAVNARYVRVMGLQRSTRYGYSMLEFEVYGVSALSELPVLTSLSIEPAVMTVTDGSTQEFMAIALDQYGEVLPTQVNWSVDGGGAIDGDGIFTASAVGGAFSVTATTGILTATAVVTVKDIPPPADNLALGAPVVASSEESHDTKAVNAVDGDPSSRWSSKFSDPQWIYVDLSEIVTIDRVVLNWETAYGKAYEIQVSYDAQNWVTAFAEGNGDGGIDDITFAAVNARYVRVMGLRRDTRYGYSLLEIEVYETSTPSDPPVLTSLSVSPAAVIVTDGATQGFTATALDQYGKVLPTPVSWLVDGGGMIDENGVFTATAVGGPFTVTATAMEDILPSPAGNLALGAPVVASSAERPGTLAENAVDGDPSSRWSSKFSDPQWIYVDLSAIFTIDRVVLNWEAAYGKAYEIQVSNDAQNWVIVFTEGDSDGGIDDLTFAAPVNARYVRVMGLQRSTRYGYSLMEFEVYGAGTLPTPCLPYDKPSVESLRSSKKKVFAHYFSPIR